LRSFGDIYRAMMKTDTSSRDELVNLIPRRKPETH
jgi:DNA-binding CsgD family transcriptional regulator